jgi:hypothetical protein
MSAAVRTGFPMTGPSPAANARSSPMPSSGGRMSAKMIVASSAKTFTGWSVTSQASSGALMSSSSECFSRSWRYSGM